MTAAFLAAAAALLISPLLAGWTRSLGDGDRSGWWRPQHLRPVRWLTVAILAAAFAAVGAQGAPAVAWWLFAVVGAVLAVVDAATHQLPARLVGPLAGAEAVVLLIAAVAGPHLGPLLRAAVAAAVVTAGYLLLALAIPSAIGLGDVYVLGIAAGLLGWAGWHHVLVGQMLVWLLGGLTAAVVAVARPARAGLRTPVPMGPALILAGLLACWQ